MKTWGVDEPLDRFACWAIIDFALKKNRGRCRIAIQIANSSWPFHWNKKICWTLEEELVTTVRPSVCCWPSQLSTCVFYARARAHFCCVTLAGRLLYPLLKIDILCTVVTVAFSRAEEEGGGERNARRWGEDEDGGELLVRKLMERWTAAYYSFSFLFKNIFWASRVCSWDVGRCGVRSSIRLLCCGNDGIQPTVSFRLS